MNAPPSPVPVMQSPPGAETVIDGRRYLYFAGTGYLGLAGHPEVIEAACSGIGEEGLLRFAVCATHTPEMIARLLAELQRVL